VRTIVVDVYSGNRNSIDYIPAINGNVNRAFGLAFDSRYNLFIADTENSRIRRIDAGTNIITTVAGLYSAGKNVNTFLFSEPKGVSVFGNNIYVADTGRHTIAVINKYTNQLINVFRHGTIGVDSSPTLLSFNTPSRTAIDTNGYIYVADSTNNRIRRINLNSGAATIVSTTEFSGLNRPIGVAVYGDKLYFTHAGTNPVGNGVIGSTMSALVGEYNSPEGLAVDSDGNLYVANTGLNNIIKVTPGPAPVASVIELPGGTTLNSPRGVAIDSTGQLHIADSGNNRIIRLNSNNTVTVLTTDLNNPHDISVDIDGSVYVADTGNNRILKIKETITISKTWV
jgi:hypothetical protein